MQPRYAAISLLLLVSACDDPGELMCRDTEPEAEVSCSADDDSCIADALESGASLSYTSAYEAEGGQYDIRTTTVVVGDQIWVRRSGVEDLCEGDSLEVYRSDDVGDCRAADCVLEALQNADDYSECFDQWECNAV